MESFSVLCEIHCVLCGYTIKICTKKPEKSGFIGTPVKKFFFNTMIPNRI